MEGNNDDFPHWKKYSEDLEVNDVKIKVMTKEKFAIFYSKELGGKRLKDYALNSIFQEYTDKEYLTFDQFKKYYLARDGQKE